MTLVHDTSIVRSTQRVLIRSVVPSDFEQLRQIWADPAVMEYMSVPPMTLEEAAETFDKMMQPNDYVRQSYRFTIVRQVDNAVVGTFGLDVERFASAYPHSMVMHRDTWGTGLATEAYHLLLRFAFDDLGVTRAWTACVTGNERVKRLVLGMGYTQFGMIREYFRREGQPVDCDVYSYLERDWRAHVRAMDAN